MLKSLDTHIFMAVGTTPLLIASSPTSKVQEIMVMRRRITGKGKISQIQRVVFISTSSACGLGASDGALNGPRLPAPV